MSSSRLWWQNWMQLVFVEAGHDTHFSATVIGYRQDCTNRSVWNRQKLCALELEASYIVASDVRDLAFDAEADADGDGDAYYPEWSRIKRLADVLPQRTRLVGVRLPCQRSCLLLWARLLGDLSWVTNSSFSQLPPLPPLGVERRVLSLYKFRCAQDSYDIGVGVGSGVGY